MKKNKSFFLGILVGIISTTVGVSAAILVRASEVSLTSTKTSATTVQDSLDELYDKVNEAAVSYGTNIPFDYQVGWDFWTKYKDAKSYDITTHSFTAPEDGVIIISNAFNVYGYSIVEGTKNDINVGQSYGGTDKCKQTIETISKGTTITHKYQRGYTDVGGVSSFLIYFPKKGTDFANKIVTVVNSRMTGGDTSTNAFTSVNYTTPSKGTFIQMSYRGQCAMSVSGYPTKTTQAINEDYWDGHDKSSRETGANYLMFPSNYYTGMLERFDHLDAGTVITASGHLDKSQTVTAGGYSMYFIPD